MNGSQSLHFALFPSAVFSIVPYKNSRAQVVPVRNTWVRANCSAKDDLRPVKTYLMNLQTSNSDQPAQTASLMRVVIIGKTISGSWKIYLAECKHFEQSAHMRRSEFLQ